MVLKLKTCCHCKEIKPILEFWKDSSKSDGIHHNCKVCGNKMSKQSYRKKRAEHGKEVIPRANRTPEEQRKVLVERAKKYREKRLTIQPDYRAVENRRALARKIGINPDVIEEHYKKQFMKQQAHCAICGKVTESLCIDHDHNTNELRGLLCGKCNVGICWFDDNSEFCKNAGQYLTVY